MSSGGDIFSGSFKMPVLQALYSILIFLVIAILLAIVFGIAFFAISYFTTNPAVMGGLAALYAFAAFYAPLDYVYTLGYNAAR